jgi:hypothetical protein
MFFILFIEFFATNKIEEKEQRKAALAKKLQEITEKAKSQPPPVCSTTYTPTEAIST